MGHDDDMPLQVTYNTYDFQTRGGFKWEVGSAFPSLPSKQPRHNKELICVHTNIDWAQHSERHATDVMTTCAETVPSIIRRAPDDRRSVWTAEEEAPGEPTGRHATSSSAVYWVTAVEIRLSRRGGEITVETWQTCEDIKWDQMKRWQINTGEKRWNRFEMDPAALISPPSRDVIYAKRSLLLFLLRLHSVTSLLIPGLKYSCKSSRSLIATDVNTGPLSPDILNIGCGSSHETDFIFQSQDVTIAWSLRPVETRLSVFGVWTLPYRMHEKKTKKNILQRQITPLPLSLPTHDVWISKLTPWVNGANMTWHRLLSLSPFNNGLSDKLTFTAKPAK